eukprot:15478436-Alexandrium_andersonii.AAC.1
MRPGTGVGALRASAVHAGSLSIGAPASASHADRNPGAGPPSDGAQGPLGIGEDCAHQQACRRHAAASAAAAAAAATAGADAAARPAGTA